MVSRGFLIVLEGIDGAGKSTLLRALRDHFLSQGQEVVTTREPGGSPFGSTLRTILQHSVERPNAQAEFLLFAADRSEHITKVVKPALERGALVISDRMEDSSLAYQGYGRGLDHAMIKSVNKWVMADVIPDATLYLRLDWETALQRIYANRTELTAFEQEEKAFFERVISGFDEIYKHKPYVCVLDGTQSPEVLAQQAIEYLVSRMAGK